MIPDATVTPIAMRRVVLITANSCRAQMLNCLLADAGFRVEIQSRGSTRALIHVVCDPPDVVCIDLAYNTYDHIVCASQIAHHSFGARVPIIAVDASTEAIAKARGSIPHLASAAADNLVRAIDAVIKGGNAGDGGCLQ